MEVKVVLSTEGKPMYYIDHYLYEVDGEKETSIYCRCTQKSKKNCRARATLTKGTVPACQGLSGTHSHEPASEEYIKRTTLNEMKERVTVESQKTARQVYNETRASRIDELRADHVDEEIGASFPTFDSTSTILHRARGQVRPPLPTSLATIVLGDSYTKTLDGRLFLIINDEEDNRILGFSTGEMMMALCNAPIVYSDGTLRVVPSVFTQLYTLHAFYRGEMIPLVYFLLPDKRKETYCRMFVLLRNYASSIGLLFRPRTFQLDFEQAALKAIRELFPASEMKGCNFHFGQCLWRKVQEIGLSTHYKKPEVKFTVRSIGALAFVPLHAIDDAWLEINADSPGPDHPAYQGLETFKEYFVATWLENATVFPRELWNHYRNDGARTTNYIEGWHQALNTAVGRAHPNVFDLVKHLQQQEQRFRNDMLLLRQGGPPPRSRQRYRRINQKLMNFAEELETNQVSLSQYLQNVASVKTRV